MPDNDARYLGYRGLTLTVNRTDGEPLGASDSLGDHYAGVVEWDLEAGSTVSTPGQAEALGRKAVDAFLDRGVAPAQALDMGGIAPLPHSVKGVAVPTAAGDFTVFYNPEPQDPDEDPHLDAAGWYHQALEFDEPPIGPYHTHEDAADEAVARMAGPGKAP